MNFIKATMPAGIKRWVSQAVLDAHRRSLSATARGIPVVELEERHISNLEVLVNRQTLLERLPREGVVCELGVDEGIFFDDILRIARPGALKLIDPWDTERYGEDKFHNVAKRFENEIDNGQIGPVPLSCRPRCSFKPPSVRKPMDFSILRLSVCGADYKSHLCIQRWQPQRLDWLAMNAARLAPP